MSEEEVQLTEIDHLEKGEEEGNKFLNFIQEQFLAYLKVQNTLVIKKLQNTSLIIGWNAKVAPDFLILSEPLLSTAHTTVKKHHKAKETHQQFERGINIIVKTIPVLHKDQWKYNIYIINFGNPKAVFSTNFGSESHQHFVINPEDDFARWWEKSIQLILPQSLK